MDNNLNNTMPAAECGKHKNCKKWKIITAISMIFAICGIGFGVYGMIQNSQKEDKPADNTETKTKEADDVAGPYIKDGYFYVPKWGTKYKLSDELTNYGYAVDQTNQGDSVGNYVVGLSAIAKSDYKENPHAEYYNNIFSCSVVTIRAMEESKKDWWGSIKADYEFNGLNFVVHDAWREDYCSDEYEASTDGAKDQLEKILSNPEKI